VVEGGKEGFEVAIRIIPFLVAMLVAVGMLRASGAIDALALLLDPLTRFVGLPAEALPMALLRPLSGSGAFGVAAEVMQTHGADSLVGQIVSTMQGSTETTFYVIALYFGVVQVRRIRHTLVACLIAEAAGVLAAVWAVRLFMG
jgi:spore maturation protein SpmB